MGQARTALDTALRRSPAQPVFHWRASRRLAVLAYHGVEDRDRFAAHLRHIRRRLHPVSLEEVAEAAEGRRGLPARAVLVTFDDGYRDVVDVAMPMLRDAGIPAAAFVVAGLLDTESPLWFGEARELAAAGGTVGWLGPRSPDDLVRALKREPDERRLAAMAELRRTAVVPARPVPQLRRAELPVLASAGVAVANHTLTHPILSRCGADTVRDEIRGAHEVLTAALGSPPVAFAYPDGACGSAVAAEVAEAGYRAAFLFDHRISPSPPPDPLRISRLRVDSGTAADRFSIIVSGLHPAIHHALGRV
jgi:peptidoglycan/xylan/chitin deacetylase (PgdA/CDA1 family)